MSLCAGKLFVQYFREEGVRAVPLPRSPVISLKGIDELRADLMQAYDADQSADKKKLDSVILVCTEIASIKPA